MFILLISCLGYHTLSFSLLSFTAYYDKYHIFICYCRHGITREISIKSGSELYGKLFKHKCSLPVKLNQILQADFISQDLQENSEIAKIVDTIIMNMGIQIMEQLLLVNSMFFFYLFRALIYHNQGIGGRVPRSFSGPLVDVLFKITGKYMQPSRQWLQTLLSRVKSSLMKQIV